MLLTTSQRIVASTARRLATTPPIRRLNHATMGFEEIAKWKEHRRRATDPRHQRNQTIFDLKIYTPTNKSSTWNISYAADEGDTEPRKAAQIATSRTSPPSPTSMWSRVHTRHYAALAAGQTTHSKVVKSKTESPIRLPAAASMFSSLAADTKPDDEEIQFSVFGAERRATEIIDVPGLDVLVKLRAEKLPPAELDLPEPQAMGIAPNGDVVPLAILEKFNHLRVLRVRKTAKTIRSTAVESPVWYP